MSFFLENILVFVAQIWDWISTGTIFIQMNRWFFSQLLRLIDWLQTNSIKKSSDLDVIHSDDDSWKIIQIFQLEEGTLDYDCQEKNWVNDRHCRFDYLTYVAFYWLQISVQMKKILRMNKKLLKKECNSIYWCNIWFDSIFI